MSEKPEWGTSNPNSQHQCWLEFGWRVRTPRTPDPDTVRRAVDAFFRALSRGSPAMCQIRFVRLPRSMSFRIDWRVDRQAYLDLTTQSALDQRVRAFLLHGFGNDVAVTSLSVRLLAGDSQTGKPAAQLLVLPRRIA